MRKTAKTRRSEPRCIGASLEDDKSEQAKVQVLFKEACVCEVGPQCIMASIL